MAAVCRSVSSGAPTNGWIVDVKSQGPDTPTLVSRSRRRLRRCVDNGGQQARRTRETAYKR